MLNAVLADAPFGFALVDTELRYLHINNLLASLNARTPEEHRGLRPVDISPVLDEMVTPVLRHVMDTRTPVVGLEVSAEPPGDGGGMRHWTFSCYPVTGPDEQLLGMAVAVVDVTERQASHDRLRAQASQQAAVLELGLAALRGDRVSVLIDTALAMVRDVLDMDRAAVMRSERGSPDFVLQAVVPYRANVVGTVTARSGDRTQCGQTLVTGLPIVMTDRAAEDRFDVIEAAQDLDVQASITVIIPTSAGPFGVLGVYSQSAREVSEDDVRFVQAVATVIGTAVDRRRTERELEGSSKRLRMAQEAGRMGVWEWNLRTGQVVWSEALEHLYGLPPGGFGGTVEVAESLIHPPDLPAVKAGTAQGLETGTLEVEYRIHRADTGAQRWVAARGEAVRDDVGRPVRMVGITIDVTERRRVEEERVELLRAEQTARHSAEAARERLTLLADATAALSASLDYHETLQAVTRLAVPDYADICVVDLIEQARLGTVAVAHRDPGAEATLWDLRRRYPPATAPGDPTRQILRDPAPLVYSELDDTLLQAMATDDEHLRLLRDLTLSSAIVVPLVARGRVLGTLTLGRTGDREGFEPGDDVPLITELGRRAALAIDNARLFSEVSRTGERFRRMAETLQTSLLPPNLPEVPGLDLAATYRAAAAGTTVGGDFYDVFPLANRGWGCVIGDVQGKGTEAAALTAIVRHTVRTAAIRRSAGGTLETLNEVLLASEEHADRFCTVLYGHIDSADEGVRIQLASGGHPPAMLRHAATGAVEPVGGAGTLMGVMPDPELRLQTVTLEPDDVLVFYTDGITEARGPGGEFGEQGLASTLALATGDTAQDYVREITRAVTNFSGGRFRDDIAIVVIRAVPA